MSGGIAVNEANWATNESLKDHHKKAIELAKQRAKYEKKLVKEGKKQVLYPHPVHKKCFIVKFE